MKKLYFDNEGAAIDLDQAIALAENQTFIKNVKPLVSNERYIAAIPTVKGVAQNYTVQRTQPVVQQKTQIALASPEKPAAQQAVKKQEPVNHQQIAYQSPAVVKQVEQPVIKQQNTVQKKPEVVQPQQQKLAANTISAGVATVRTPQAPVITTTAVTKTPTTNVKLAESYYINVF